MSTQDEVAEKLRSWARGMYALEAGTELLLRAFGGIYADEQWPWIKAEGGTTWVDFERIPDEIGVLSSGQQRVLLIAASLGAGQPLNLADTVSGLDRQHLALVLAAVSHAGGSHEHNPDPFLQQADGGVELNPARHEFLAPLFPWPED